MKIRSLYKNLDTAFVNLAALLQHLRQKGFVGLVRVDTGDYQTEIIYDEARRVRLRESPSTFGKTSSDNGALERLLVRARRPGGVINVYEEVGKADRGRAARENEKEDILELTPPSGSAGQEPHAAPPAKIPAPAKPPEKVFAAAFENGGENGNGFQHGTLPKPYTNGNRSSSGAGEAGQEFFPIYSEPVEIVEEKPKPKRKISYLSADEWEELTTLTAALLGAADNILKTANLGFSDAFNKARIEISGECPFLHPERGVFHYAEGRVGLYEEVPPNLLVSGVSECLRRILNKLVSNPKFFALYKHITQQILILVRQRRPQFDKFGYTRQLERIIKF